MEDGLADGNEDLKKSGMYLSALEKAQTDLDFGDEQANEMQEYGSGEIRFRLQLLDNETQIIQEMIEAYNCRLESIENTQV